MWELPKLSQKPSASPALRRDKLRKQPKVRRQVSSGAQKKRRKWARRSLQATKTSAAFAKKLSAILRRKEKDKKQTWRRRKRPRKRTRSSSRKPSSKKRARTPITRQRPQALVQAKRHA